MKVLMVELINHRFWVGIVLVKHEFALAIPPEPVLHDVVDRNVQFTVLARHAENFVLRFVAILALPETVGPLAEHRRLPGKLAIASNHLVEFRTVKEVVVDDVSNFRTDVQIIGKSVVESAARVIVPEDSVAVAGHQKWNGNASVVLRNVDRVATIVPDARLMLAKSIQSLMG